MASLLRKIWRLDVFNGIMKRGDGFFTGTGTIVCFINRVAAVGRSKGEV